MGEIASGGLIIHNTGINAEHPPLAMTLLTIVQVLKMAEVPNWDAPFKYSSLIIYKILRSCTLLGFSVGKA
jgi:hypothetical protein